MKLQAALFLAVFGCSAAAQVATVVVESNSPAIHGGELSESIGLETLGGVFTPLLVVGCPLPCEVTQTFSTAVDRQGEISIALYRGTADLASENHSLGRFVVKNIPPAPRGQPQIAITFLADSGAIRLSARELSGATIQLQREAP